MVLGREQLSLRRKIKNLKYDLQWQRSIFAFETKSQNGSRSIVKIYYITNNPQEVQTAYGRCAKTAADTLCALKQQIFKNISLSANRVVKNVKDLTGDVKERRLKKEA